MQSLFESMPGFDKTIDRLDGKLIVLQIVTQRAGRSRTGINRQYVIFEGWTPRNRHLLAVGIDSGYLGMNNAHAGESCQR